MDIAKNDLPVCVITAGDEFILYDVHSVERARFATAEEAHIAAEEINATKPPELMQPDIHDTGTEPVQEEQEKPKPKAKSKAKAKAKSKGKSMPRGIPNKKRASKKPAVNKRAVKKAAVVKKTAKKTTKGRKKSKR